MSPFAPTFSDSKAFVYHYTKSKTATEKILASKRMRFGRFRETNDPKECKEWHFDMWSRGNSGVFGDRNRVLADQLSNALKQNTRLLCFSEDAAPLQGNHLFDIHKRGFAKPRMWAQYAENHSGVCLIFNRQKLDEEIARQCKDFGPLASGAVRYADRSIVPELSPGPFVVDADMLQQIGLQRYARWHLERHMKTLFFEKMTDWRDEAEFRWVLFSESEDDVFVEFNDALVGIMFGDSAASKDIDEIMRLTDGLGIAYTRLKWKNSSPWYDFADLRYSAAFRAHSRKSQPAL